MKKIKNFFVPLYNLPHPIIFTGLRYRKTNRISEQSGNEFEKWRSLGVEVMENKLVSFGENIKRYKNLLSRVAQKMSCIESSITHKNGIGQTKPSSFEELSTHKGKSVLRLGLGPGGLTCNSSHWLELSWPFSIVKPIPGCS